MRVKFFIFFILFAIASSDASNLKFVTSSEKNYLKKPMGQYGVGFRDFQWINNNFCPDFNFNGKNFNDFSPANIKHCHEIIARIYYPTKPQENFTTLYYQPFLTVKKDEISNQVANVNQIQLTQLDQLKSYAISNTQVISGKKFPVLLFSPGFSYPAEAYENFITEIVSRGYIVIGINTPFINLVALPNGHIIEPASGFTDDDLNKKLLPLQSQDILTVFQKIHQLHNSNDLFSSMDLTHVGLFGHSIGAVALANLVHAHPTYFQAAATLDIGLDETGNSLKKFDIPFMYLIAADRKLTPPGIPTPVFNLGNYSYLVQLTSSDKNHKYSSHDNFSDLSTLQYLPLFQTLAIHQKQIYNVGFNFLVISHNLTDQQRNNFSKTTYVLIKKSGKWDFTIYENGKKPRDIDISMIADLPEALSKLSNKPPEQFSPAQIDSIKKVMAQLHYILYGKSFIGVGNGWTITASINTYLLQFFDTFLKNKASIAFKNCLILSKDSVINCGPGQA